MIRRTLREIQEMVKGSGLRPEFEQLEIAGVNIDSRQIEPGNVYIPILGARVDGHDFLAGARANGAAAVLWLQGRAGAPEDFPVIFVADTEKALQGLATAYRDQLNIKIVGITGSNGKTSTKDIMASILGAKFKVHKTAGNFNSEFGMPLTILRAEPEAEVAVLEMGMRGMHQINLLSTIARPDAAIITNIGEAHIEELGSRENISIAKFEIKDGLKDGGIFVYHGDEPLLVSKVVRLKAPNYRIETFGDTSSNDYYPTSMKITETGMSFTIAQSDVVFQLPVLGKHNVMNALAAMAVARDFGMSFEEIQQGMKNLEMTAMRMEVVKAESGFTIINDAYNASPTSVKATLDLLVSLKGYSKKIAVLGDMLELGDREITYHEETGAYLDPAHIDLVLTFGPLAKHLAAHSKVADTRAFEDKEALAAALKDAAAPDAIALVKGSRGMKLEDVIDQLL